MDDQFINKLISKMAEVFATKNDLERVDQHITKVEQNLLKVEQNLTNEIKSVGDTLSGSTHDLDASVEDHEKRLKKIESLPSIAHQIKA